MLYAVGGNKIHKDDESDWWDQVSSIADTQGWKAIVITPCCSKSMNLFELMFSWSAGFARFELAIHNPESSKPLDQSVLNKIEDIIGCKMHEIWAYY